MKKKGTTQSMERVDDILKLGDFEALMGLVEDVHLEAKREPYDLESADARYELAKDVSAFANADGGYLLIGVATRRDPNQDTDILSSLELFAPGAFAVHKYQGIIIDHLFPSIDDLQVTFLPQKDHAEGLGAIAVPRQHPDRGPFLISRVVEDGEYLKQIVAGYAERKGDRNEPLSPTQLQQRLKKGSDTIARRLASIEDKLEAVLLREEAPSDVDVIDREGRDEKISRIRESLE